MKRFIEIQKSLLVATTPSHNGIGTVCSDFTGRDNSISADTGSGCRKDIIDW